MATASIQQLPNPPIEQTHSLETNKNVLHRYVTYDPRATLSRSEKWSNFWSVARIVNVLACASLALSLTLVGCSALSGPFAVVSFFPGLLAFWSINCHFRESKNGHIVAIEFANSIIAKMNAIKDEEIPAKLEAMGISSDSVPLTENKQIKQLIARFEHFDELKKRAEHFLEVLKEEKKRGCDLLLLGSRLSHCKQALTSYSLEKAYILHVLMHPHDVRGRSAFVLSLNNKVRQVLGGINPHYYNVFAIAKFQRLPHLPLLIQDLLSSTPRQLSDVIFNDRGIE